MGYDPRQDPAVNHRRTAPKVPGFNAQPLQPSIGTDGWNTSQDSARGQSAFAGSQHCKRFGVRPTHGKIEAGDCGPAERREMAIEYAKRIAKGRNELALIEMATGDTHNRAMARSLAQHLGSGHDRRKVELAGVIGEILG